MKMERMKVHLVSFLFATLCMCLIAGNEMDFHGEDSNHDGLHGKVDIAEATLSLDVLRMIERGAIDELNTWLTENPDLVDSKSYREGECTGLAYAATLGHAQVVALFLTHGANRDTPCHKERLTPLMLACICSMQTSNFNHNLCPAHLQSSSNHDDHTQVVQNLLEGGADWNVTDVHGRRAIHFSANNGNSRIIKLLLNYGDDVNVQDKHGWTPLLYATQKNSGRTIRVLLQQGADITKTDQSGKFALSHAVHVGNKRAVSVLLEYGSPCITENGSPLVGTAEYRGHSEIAKMLQSGCAPVHDEL